jgi:hypothetical protein
LQQLRGEVLAARRIGDTARGRWRVRWHVAGREHCQSFPVCGLADGFLAELKDAARAGRWFDELTGLRAIQPAAVAGRTWYEHARWYAEAKWPQLVGTSRRSVAEALTNHRRADRHPLRRAEAQGAARGTVWMGVQPRRRYSAVGGRGGGAGLGRRGIAAGHRARDVLKGKSMTTAEIGLNEALASAGIDVQALTLGISGRAMGRSRAASAPSHSGRRLLL